MPLNTTQLKTDIKAILDDLAGRDADPAKAREDFANQLGDKIESYVKSGLVSVHVTTTGSATAQAGNGTGTIS